MNEQQFKSLAQQGFNRIPLVRRILADLETPLSVYLKLANKPYSFLLESVEGGEKWGRYSIIGLGCKAMLQVNNHTIHVYQEGKIIDTVETEDPFIWIQSFFGQYRIPELAELPRFNGGLVGYFGYDTVRYAEKRLGPPPNPDPIHTPDIILLLSEELVVFDNLNHTLYFIVHADPQAPHAYQKSQEHLGNLIENVKQKKTFFTESTFEFKANEFKTKSNDLTPANFTSNISREEYNSLIDKIKNYIVEGDVMQVVFSRRMTAPFQGNSLNLYRALRYLNPSPYMYYFDMDDFHIVGSSPELLVRLENDNITLRPLAGTRPRGKTETEDQRLEQELLADPKEIAEHLMLIDLGRNDVGKVSSIGSVKVPKVMAIERYSHVMHISSTVTGQLQPHLTALDLLKATLPAGTLSGAPKIRAMEIIDELENLKRGIYGGAVGYLAWNGNMDMAIALRTAIIKANTIYLQTGGGIVADSRPEEEWQETQRKANALIAAVALAEKDLIL